MPTHENDNRTKQGEGSGPAPGTSDDGEGGKDKKQNETPEMSRGDVSRSDIWKDRSEKRQADAATERAKAADYDVYDEPGSGGGPGDGGDTKSAADVKTDCGAKPDVAPRQDTTGGPKKPDGGRSF